MTATEEIFARVGSAAASGGGRVLEDQQLAALRKVLLAQEREQLRKILHRLDDPATRAAELARILPEAIALRGADDQAFAETLAPVVRIALADALKECPDLLVAAMRGALRETLFAPWRFVGRSFRRLHRRRGEAARIEQLYLISRETGAFIEQTLRPHDADDEFAAEDARRVASMVTYLLAFLREPEHLMRYAALGQVRIERFTYGIYAGAAVVLLAVIHGNIGVEAELERCREICIKIGRHRQNEAEGNAENSVNSTATSWLPRLEQSTDHVRDTTKNDAPATSTQEA